MAQPLNVNCCEPLLDGWRPVQPNQAKYVTTFIHSDKIKTAESSEKQAMSVCQSMIDHGQESTMILDISDYTRSYWKPLGQVMQDAPSKNGYNHYQSGFTISDELKAIETSVDQVNHVIIHNSEDSDDVDLKQCNEGEYENEEPIQHNHLGNFADRPSQEAAFTIHQPNVGSKSYHMLKVYKETISTKVDNDAANCWDRGVDRYYNFNKSSHRGTASFNCQPVSEATTGDNGSDINPNEDIFYDLHDGITKSPDNANKENAYEYDEWKNSMSEGLVNVPTSPLQESSINHISYAKNPTHVGDNQVNEEEIDLMEINKDPIDLSRHGRISFQRFQGSLQECTGINRHILGKRLNYLNNLAPDEDIFKNLDNVKEWDTSELIPPLNLITALEIKQIKKGMANGRLYNMDEDIIRKIFPVFSQSIPIETEKGCKTKRCTLCPKLFRDRRDARVHIEHAHTMCLIKCVYCNTLFTSTRSLRAHRCDCSREQTNSHNFGSDESYSFERLQGPLKQYTPSNHKTIKRRLKNVKNLTPDETIFKDLEDVEEWDESEMIPSPRLITALDIKRIKKGMANGRLYNMGLDIICQVFPSLSLSASTAMNGNSGKSRRLRCPLCCEIFLRRCEALIHIERDHTMNIITCVNCKALLTSHDSCRRHRCSIKGTRQRNQDNQSSRGIF